MRRFVAVTLVVMSTTLLVTGCVDCMVRGIDARTCGRMKTNEKVIDRHQAQTANFTDLVRTGKFGVSMSREEVRERLGKTCDRYRDDPLPADPHSPKVRLGLYYENRFCKLYERDSSLAVQKREVRLGDKHGEMYFVLTDGVEVLEHFSWPITYTKNGYMFGEE